MYMQLDCLTGIHQPSMQYSVSSSRPNLLEASERFFPSPLAAPRIRTSVLPIPTSGMIRVDYHSGCLLRLHVAQCHASTTLGSICHRPDAIADAHVPPRLGKRFKSCFVRTCIVLASLFLSNQTRTWLHVDFASCCMDKKLPNYLRLFCCCQQALCSQNDVHMCCVKVCDALEICSSTGQAQSCQ